MRIPSTTVVLLAFSALAGCVSLKRTAEPRYFALRPVARTPPEAASIAPASADVALVVGVLPLALPGHLDRPQMCPGSVPTRCASTSSCGGRSRWPRERCACSRRTWAGCSRPSGDHGALAGFDGASVPRARGRRSLRPGTGWGRVALRPLRAPSRRRRARAGCPCGGPAAPSASPTRDPARAVEAMSALLADLATRIADAVTGLRSDGERAAAHGTASAPAER